MRKTKILLLLLCLSAICLLTACKKAHSHEFGEWITVKNATCTEEGERERYCFCLEKETESLAALGHQLSEEASCTKSQHCLVCNAVMVPPKQHRFGNYTVTKSPTCTEKGERERICANCEEKQTQPVYPTGHNHGDWIIVKEATCEEDGIREQFCACGDKRTSTIQALGHNFTEWSMIKEASCTEEGRKERYCFCGKKEMQIIPIFHPYNEVIVKEATKFEDGLKELTCPLCQNKTEVIIPAIVSHGLAYRVNSDGVTCTIIGIGTCTDKDVIIPKHIEGYTVTTIGDEAFKGYRLMVSLMIPSTVTKIGNEIVSGARSLTTVYYYSSAECSPIAFNNAPIKKVVFGGTIAFKISVHVEEIVFSDTITHIPSRTFENCQALKSITIPEGITSIGDRAFADCTNLTYISLPDTLTEIGSFAFSNCKSLKSIVIPEGVTKISDYMFYFCESLESVVIPQSITSIDQYAFTCCTSLTEITLPSNLTFLGSGAFSSCTSLTSFTIPKGISHLSAYLFADSKNLINITFTGTIADWRAISNRYMAWKSNSKVKTVTCIDGVINL